MLTVLDKIIGYIAPHQCLACGSEGALLCEGCLPLLPDLQPQCYRCARTTNGNNTCTACRRSSPVHNVWVRTSYDGFGEEVLHKLKFERAYAAADTIARSMARLELSSNAVLVPIPTATSRVRQRGYDQSVLIAKRLSEYTGLPCSNALIRYGQQRQTGNTRKLRRAQLADAFHVNVRQVTGITSVILIDDVLTTGATIEAAAFVLRQNGVKHISAALFARVQ